MGFASSWMVMLMVLVGGGAGNHLLDYASTKSYWKAKNVDVTLDAMAGELKSRPVGDITGVVAELGSPDPAARQKASAAIADMGEAAIPQLRKAVDSTNPETAAAARSLIADITAASKPAAVRRLMAIRTLGELRKQEALPILRPLVDSREMFVGEYAARAIALIENKPAATIRPAASARSSDLWLLPADCRMVGQIDMPVAPARSIEEWMASLPADMPLDKQEVLDEITKGVLSVAERIGDVRLDGVTFGVSGTVDPEHGFGIAIVRGVYDRNAAMAALRKDKVKSEAADGQTLFLPEDEMGLLPASDERFIVMAGADRETMPVAAVTSALKANKGNLGDAKEMAKLIDGIDTAQPLWAAMKVTDSYRAMPALAVFDELTVVGRKAENAIEVECNAKGTDAEKVRLVVTEMNAEIEQGLKELQQEVERMPALASIAKIGQSIKLTAEGASARMTLSLPAGAQMTLPMMLFGSHAEPAVVQPPLPPEVIQPVPVQPEP